MIFGPKLRQEETKYSEHDYYGGLRAVQFFDDAARNEAIDHIRSLLSGKVPERILEGHPFESVTILKDAAITRTAYLLRKYGDLKNDVSQNEEVITEILHLNGVATSESNRMLKVIDRLTRIAKDRDDMELLEYIYTTSDAIHTYALMTGLVKETIKYYRR